MAARLEKCKAVFRERILANFPEARERFSKYFDHSYQVIRLMPNSRDTASVLHPDRSRGVSVESFNLDFALTALGLKPLYLPDNIEATASLTKRLLKNDRWKEAVAHARLKIFRHNGNFCIYDPELVAPILSDILNTYVTPENTNPALSAYIKAKPHYFSNLLLGYPQMLAKNRTGVIRVTSHGYIEQPSTYYFSVHSFGVMDPSPVVNEIKRRGEAVALIEDMRKSFSSIKVTSGLEYSSESERTSHGIIIERSGEPGEWKTYDFRQTRHIHSVKGGRN